MKRISFRSVSKEYMYERERKLKYHFLNPFNKTIPQKFNVFHNLSFDIHDDEAVGIIGPNGAGKTTILKLIAKIIYPTRGKIAVHGKVAPLIELGAGFHPDFSGRENMYLNGSILGMSVGEVSEKLENILEFAGPRVREFFDAPIKKYSLGMKARLGFAVAVHADPDILLVDESLSVGDVEFQAKCLKKLDQFKKAKKTIVITSHNHEFIHSFCTRIISL